MNTSKVRIAEGYDMRLKDLDDFEKVARERGLPEALYEAYKAGWQRHGNMIRNDAKRRRRAV